MRVPGASVNQEQKCWHDGKRERSGPISLAKTSAVSVPIVGIAVRSTPNTSRSARCSQSFIGAAHRARLIRLDKGRANKAIAHQLARLIYAMLTRGEDYVERSMDEFENQRRARQLKNLKRRAHQLGMTVSPLENAA